MSASAGASDRAGATSGAAHGGTSGGRAGSWTVLALVLESAQYLSGKGVERARLDAEHLLGHALGIGRLDLYLQYDRPLTPEELAAFRPLVRRRASREPLQYILGRQPFRFLDLVVDPRVLIPRPETEVLVEHVLTWAEGRPDALEALDIGTGSGAVALALAAEGPFSRVVGVDAEEDAIEVARLNRSEAGLDDRVDLRPGRDFSALRAEERFDVLVSNPPYVAEVDRGGLQPEVARWEPEAALFAGDDGLDVLRRIVSGGPEWVRDDGLIALEVGDGQAERVAGLLHATGRIGHVEIEKDLTGRPRFVMATVRSGSPRP